MKDESSHPLAPEIAAWLRRAEPYPAAPPNVQARVHAALALRIAAGAASGGDGTDSEPSGSTASGGTNTDSTNAGVANTEGAGTSALGSSHAFSEASSLGARFFSTTAHAVSSLAVTFAVGGAVGAAMVATLLPPRERVVYVDRPSPAVLAPPLAQPGEAIAPPRTSTPDTAKEIAAARGNDGPDNEVPRSTHGAPVPSKGGTTGEVRPATATRGEGSTTGSSSVSDLEMEQKLLDVARTALARGNASDALPSLDRHAQRYPKGLLAEEREALAINALVTLERYDEARARGSRFLRRYPESLLRASVEAALRAIP